MRFVNWDIVSVPFAVSVIFILAAMAFVSA